MVGTARGPFFGSLSIHVLVLLALVALRDAQDTSQAADTAPRTAARLVFLNQGRGGGRGGGGERSAEPIRRAQARGADRTSVPATPPPTLSSQFAPPPIQFEAPVLSAIPAFADAHITRGLIDPQLSTTGSQGSGQDDGAGTGSRGGGGPGEGRRFGRGGPRGFGDGAYEGGNGVTTPVPVRQVRPQYTTAAMSARIGGSVWVECIVMPDGTVGEVRIVKSLDGRSGLDEEAVKAARQWRFRPGTLNGRPVAVRVTIELSFSIY